jgi:hypothetical protein
MLVENAVSVIAPTFFRHKEKSLKSSEWAVGIKAVGQYFFGGAPEFRDVLCRYASEVGFSFVYDHNNRERVSAHCAQKVDKNYRWKVLASVEKSNGFMYIRTLVNEHICGTVYKRFQNIRLSSDVVSNFIVDDVRSKPTTKPKEIMKHVKTNFGFDISYRIALNSLEKAKTQIYGESSFSFNRLQSYFQRMKTLDPSSQFQLEINPTNRTFERCFVAFGACLHGFQSCRPLLNLDGTFLTDKYKGILLSAIAKDGNQGIVLCIFSLCFNSAF